MQLFAQNWPGQAKGRQTQISCTKPVFRQENSPSRKRKPDQLSGSLITLTEA